MRTASEIRRGSQYTGTDPAFFHVGQRFPAPSPHFKKPPDFFILQILILLFILFDFFSGKGSLKTVMLPPVWIYLQFFDGYYF